MTARETNATIATATSKINGRLFITIPVTATSLYVLVNVTLFSFSPTKLFFPFYFNVSNASVSCTVLFVTVVVLFSTTVTLGVYPSVAASSFTI